MVNIIVIKKSGDIKYLNAKNVTKENLYKKAGLSNSKNFDMEHTWMINDSYYSVFAKNTGKAGSENKFELPPPIDENLYFGNMVFIKHSDEEANDIENLKGDEFKELILNLFGGFEDLEEDESTSEEEEIPDNLKTKNGYSKEDGFVVSDDDVEFEDLDDDSEYDGEQDYVEEEDDDAEKDYEYDEDEGEGEEEEDEEEEDEGEEEEDEEDEDEEDDEEEEEEDDDDDDDEEEYEDEYLSEESYDEDGEDEEEDDEDDDE